MSYVKCLCWSLGHAEQLLFSENIIFLDIHQTRSTDIRVHRAGSQLKNHWHFHIETTTFKPRHENKSCSACPKDQTWQLDTFEHRHENKSCSACLKDQTWQLDNLENFTGSQRLSDFQTFFFWFSNILTWSGLDHRDAYWYNLQSCLVEVTVGWCVCLCGGVPLVFSPLLTLYQDWGESPPRH